MLAEKITPPPQVHDVGSDWVEEMASTNSQLWDQCWAGCWGTQAVRESAFLRRNLALGVQVLYWRKKVINLENYSF